ncbi:hypothetical protein ACJJTC_018448 [Scirpophaga incertulas]
MVTQILLVTTPTPCASACAGPTTTCTPNVTVEFVRQKREKWLQFNHFKASVKEALVRLNALVDESDPDTALPNIVHAFQTAERIRADHPHHDWLHLTGLIHDLGKVMAFYGEPQWCVVGDTFPVGCKWADSIVYGPDSFKDNPDTYNPKYNTKYGMYGPRCGLDRLLMSWGHDEYLYQFLKHNKTKLPEKALYMIRLCHSNISSLTSTLLAPSDTIRFYPWHSGGDYRHLTNEKDGQILQWVLEFNKYDLYTKSESVPDIEALWPYYEILIDKYIPGICEF